MENTWGIFRVSDALEMLAVRAPLLIDEAFGAANN